METRFQTSFIPRKPITAAGQSMVSTTSHHTFGGLFMAIATVLFVVSLLSVGGAYFWKGYLNSAQASLQTQLKARESNFQIDLIQQLEEQSVKIDIAKRVLTNHIAASQVFAFIGALTSEHVRFTSLDFSASPSSGGNAKVQLAGIGQSLYTVAFQSKVLSQLDQYGLFNIVKNPILSNPAQNANGTVAFSLSAEIAPSALLYEKSAAGSTGQSGIVSSTTPSKQ